MAPEAVILRARTREEGEGTAEIVRSTAQTRLGKAIGLALGGVLFGALTLPIPILHWVAPWLLPLMGFALAWFVYTQGPRISGVAGTCPKCDGSFTSPETGHHGDDFWVRCSSCNEPLHPVLTEG
jgi:hypothetical protein